MSASTSPTERAGLSTSPVFAAWPSSRHALPRSPSGHASPAKRLSQMGDMHLDLEARISDYYSKVPAEKPRSFLVGRAPYADSELEVVKGLMRDLASETAEIRRKVSVQGRQLEAMRAELQTSPDTDSIIAMFRCELEKLRMEAQGKVELLHHALRQDMDAMKHDAAETHAQEALARDMLRKELSGHAATQAHLAQQRVETLEAELVKLHGHVSDIAVGVDAAETNMQETMNRFAAEVKDCMRSAAKAAETTPTPAQPPEACLRPPEARTEPTVAQLAQQVRSLRDAFDAFLHHDQVTREAQIDFAHRMGAWQEVSRSKWEEVAERIAVLEGSAWSETRSESPPPFHKSDVPASVSRAFNLELEPEPTPPASDALQVHVACVRRVDAAEKVLRQLIYAVAGEPQPPLAVPGSSLLEFYVALERDSEHPAHEAGPHLQESGYVWRLSLMERAVRQLIHEVVGEADSLPELPPDAPSEAWFFGAGGSEEGLHRQPGMERMCAVEKTLQQLIYVMVGAADALPALPRGALPGA